jgi:ABC-type transport system substrate-binding protein
MLKAVGIDAKVVPTEVNNIVSEIRKPGQFQGIATHSVGSIYPDPDDLLIRFSSRSEPRINSATYKSERYDAAYDRSLREMDQAARKEALIEVGEVLADEQPRLFVVWLDDLYVVSKKVIIPDGIKGGYEFMASIPRWQLRP